MRRTAYLSFLASVVTVGAACTASEVRGAGEHVSESVTALALGQGVYPYPISMQADGVTPKKDATGAPLVSWTGSVADLMAADALTDCAIEWQRLYDPTAQDSYLKYLGSKMIADESCYATCAGNCPAITYWQSLRTNSACNYNTSSKTPQPLPSWDLRNVSAYEVTWSPADAVHDAATQQFAIAETNLCMAQKLREEMVTAPGLLLQEADVREVLEVIRERAQVAVLQYSLLGVAFTSPDTRVVASPIQSQILPILRAFANNPSYTTQLTQIGQDFASAIELHAQITQELATDLGREASARIPWPNAPAGQPALDWSVGSWRERVLRLMYGGDPLSATATSSGSLGDSLWQVYAQATSPAVPSTYVSADARTPQVDELQTLASVADALYFLATNPIDYATSATQLYRTVEASLRHPECKAPTATIPTCAADAWKSDIPDPTTALTQSLLYQHGITLDHAVALSTRIGQAMPMARVTTIISLPHTRTTITDSEGPIHFTGPQQYIASASTTVLPGAHSGAWYHLAANAVAVPQSVTERGSRYLGGFYLPMTLDVTNVDTTQGFVGAFGGSIDNATVNGPGEMRGLGAVSALAVARDALFTAQLGANGTAGTATSKAFVNAASAALPVITAAIGVRTAAVRPEPVSEYVDDACAEWGNTAPGYCWVVGQTLTNGEPTWQVTVETPSTDAFTQLAVFTGGAMAATAALDPSFVSYSGVTMASLASTAQVLSATTTQTGPNGTVRRIYTVPSNDVSDWYFLVKPSTGTGVAPKYQLLFGPQTLTTASLYEGATYVSKSLEGRWLGAGGSLNAFAARLWTTLPQNWSQPQYDGFGLPTNWFPPTAPELFGGQPGESATTFYTGQAESAAATAQGDIEKAVSELLAEESDSATLNAARVKAGALSSQAMQALCGASTTCTTDVAATTFSLFSDPANNNQEFVQTLSCTNAGLSAATCTGYATLINAYNALVNQIVPSQIYLPTAVWQHRWDGSLPAYASYQGGALQGDFTSTWNALFQLNRTSWASEFSVASKIQAAVAGQAVVNASNATVAAQCSYSAMLNAFNAGVSITPGQGGKGSADSTYSSGDPNMQAGENGISKDDAMWSYNLGSLWSQVQACQSATIGLGPAQTQAAAAVTDAWSTAAQQLVTLAAAVSAVSLSASNVWKDATAATTTTAQAQLDATLTAAGLQTRFGSYRRFYSYDMWNAEQAIQTARVDAVLARRAIESRFVVDLSTMLTPEAAVSAPSTWADTIYQGDLSPLGTLGLSISGVQNGQAPLNTDFFTQYVSNLNQFVSGYFAIPAGGGGRQASVQPSQGDVITLPAPDGRVADMSGNPILDPASLAWEFQCAGGTTWFVNPASGKDPAPATSPLLTACSGKPPTDARLAFSLDGWGRLNSDEANMPSLSPLSHNFNVRWNSLAVNLVGASVKDCSTAAPGTSCNPAELYVPYSMTVLGPSWVTDYNESWHVLATPIGAIEDGQAGATDDLWTQPPSGQAQSEITAMTQPQFVLRPVAGTYQLDLDVAAGINLSNIQYVQIYTNTTYWVRQTE